MGQLRLWPGPIPACTCPQCPWLLKFNWSQLWEHLSIQIFHTCRVYQANCRDLNCRLCSCMERFLIPLPSSLHPWGSAVVLASSLCVGCPQCSPPVAALEHLGLPWWGQGAEVAWLLGLWEPWQWQVCGGLVAVRDPVPLVRRCAGKTAATGVRDPALVGAFSRAQQLSWEDYPWWCPFIVPGGRHMRASPGGALS